MNVRDQVGIVSKRFLQGLKKILKSKLHAAYLYGAVTFSDDLPTGDIDFHVILKSPLSAEQKLRLEKMHEQIDRDLLPSEAEMDGYYLLLEDALKKENPKSQMWKEAVDESWALHREHILAGRCIVLYGADPGEIYQPASWKEIETALEHELQYVKENLTKYPGYCIFQLCRLIYSHRTKDVVISKARATKWAYDSLPNWRPFIDPAKKLYAKKATEAERNLVLSEITELFDIAETLIQKEKSKCTDKISRNA